MNEAAGDQRGMVVVDLGVDDQRAGRGCDDGLEEPDRALGDAEGGIVVFDRVAAVDVNDGGVVGVLPGRSAVARDGVLEVVVHSSRGRSRTCRPATPRSSPTPDAGARPVRRPSARWRTGCSRLGPHRNPLPHTRATPTHLARRPTRRPQRSRRRANARRPRPARLATSPLCRTFAHRHAKPNSAAGREHVWGRPPLGRRRASATGGADQPGSTPRPRTPARAPFRRFRT